MSAAMFDTVIIGTGQSGKPLAIALARAGWKVAVIEREYVGGTCINVGCTPTKTMVASGRVAYLARRAKDYGVDAGRVTVNMRRVIDRKRRMVESFRNYGQKTLEKTANLELVFGEARFKNARRVVVELKGGGTRELEGKRIVVNTGGRPAVPTIPGLDRIRFLDSSSIMELAELPKHLIVLGGGYVGLEFCQMFRRCGARDRRGRKENLGKPSAPRAGARAEFRPPQPRRRRRRDRQFRLHQGEPKARDQCPGHLRDRRRERRARLHAHLLRRFPRPARELAERRQRDHRRATGAELHVHRSSARDGRTERKRGAETRHRPPRGETADDGRGPRAGDERDARFHEGGRGRKNATDSRLHRSRR